MVYLVSIGVYANMKITNFIVKNFKPFALAAIKKLEIFPSSDVQIFIGDNGSGKSSLLNELVPTPAVRSDYTRDGYKQIQIEHSGSIYILTSDFGSSKHAHSFVKDGEELNLSGTTGIQNELIEQHLGYTQMTADILHYRIHMTTLGKTDRKNFLLNLNPVDLSLVMSQHKQVCSKLKEIKSNIKLLRQKQSQLELELLTPDLLTNLQNKVDLLNKELVQSLAETHRLKDIIQQLESKETFYRTIEECTTVILNVGKTARSLLPKLAQFTLIDRRQDELHRRDIYTTYKHQFNTTQSTILEQEDKLGTLAQEIDRYRKYIAENDTTVTVELLEQTLKELTSKIYNYTTSVFIPKEQYDQQVELLNTVSQSILNFRRHRVKCNLDSVRLNKLCQKRSQISQKVNTFQNELTRVTVTIEKIQKELSEYTLFNPCSSDLSQQCEYYMKHAKRIGLLKDELTTLQKQEYFLINQQTKYTKVSEKLCSFVEWYTQVYQEMCSICEDLSRTVFSMSQKTCADTLITSPEILQKKIHATITESLLHYEEIENQKTVETLQLKLKTLSESNMSGNFVKELLGSRLNEYTVVQATMTQLVTKLKSCQEYIEKHEKFDRVLEIITALEGDLSRAWKSLIILVDKQFANMMLQQHEVKISNISTELRELTTTLQTQTGYTARMKDTVDTLQQLEQELHEYSLIEKSISPYTGFPHKHLVDYTNTLIRNVNCVLAQVWTYPLQLIELTYDKSFDGTFEILVDEHVVPDISRLSKGQQAMVNLAWTLAFIISKKLMDYPVFFDECDEGLDPTHKQNLLDWLKSLIDQGLVNQLWMIHHEAVLFEGFVGSEVLCLMDGNIVRPEKMNTHVVIQ